MTGAFHWRKLGQLYEPGGDRHPKLLTHAANPLAVLLAGDVYRVFYSGRDAGNRSSVGAVDIDIVARRVFAEHREPVFEHGPEGSFFEAGVSIGNAYETGGQRYMLFMGWQVPKGGHWRGDIGRLKVGDDLSLRLDGAAPFMAGDATDPVSLSYPWVTASGEGYEMWYGSTVAWDAGNGEMLHVVKHAVSDDGHAWRRTGLAVPYEIGRAQAFSRPTVLRAQSGDLEMWFSYRSGRGETYRIGYARKPVDGPWRLALEEAGIAPSAAGWDSEMIEYPFVLAHEGRVYMLYNGNGYGRTGFGLAVREAAGAQPVGT